MPNMHEVNARHRKARTIAVALYAQGVTAEMAEGFDTDERFAVAKAIGVRPPSPSTWKLVVADLADFAVRPSMRQPADPFSGMPGCGVAS